MSDLALSVIINKVHEELSNLNTNETKKILLDLEVSTFVFSPYTMYDWLCDYNFKSFWFCLLMHILRLYTTEYSNELCWDPYIIYGLGQVSKLSNAPIKRFINTHNANNVGEAYLANLMDNPLKL